MAKSVTLLFALSLMLLCLCTSLSTAPGEQPQTSSQVTEKDNESSHPTNFRLIHRRYLRIPTKADAPQRTIVISVAGEEVKRLDASLAMSSADSYIEFDVNQWMGAVIKLESRSGANVDGEKLFALVSQSNQRLDAETKTVSPGQETANTNEKAGEVAADGVSFAFDIQPLLSEKCFVCHGPDSKNAESDLNLSDRANAIDYEAFVAGDSENSNAIARIISDDEDLRMPPPESHKTGLSDAEIKLLKRWIDQGAQYEKHWAFNRLQPAADVPLPTTADPQDSFVRNPIDTFVSSKLTEADLKPNPDDAPHRLIRRLSFDLVGLPPSPDTVKRFVDNPTDDVYAEIVDELLASHHYGEHWTLHWLDAVRYADTHGIHFDNRRAIWPYRDWVIDAFNRNLPFDQFTIQQIAGDMLPAATTNQKVASGYNRCLPTTNEGGVIDAEVAVNNANDQTASTFAVWQGLTVGCAACHDHKFDPISQKEYYQLTAFFRNNEMLPKDGNRTAPPPIIPVPSDSQVATKSALQKEKDSLVASYKADLQQWRSSQQEHSLESLASQFAELEGSLSKLPVPEFEYLPQADDVKSEEETKSEMGVFGPTPVFNHKQFIRPDADLPNDLGSSFSVGGFVRIEPETAGTMWSKMFADQKKGWDLSFDWDGKAVVRVIDDPNENSLDVTLDMKINDGKWHHVFVVFDLEADDSQLKIYVDGTLKSYYLNSSSVSRLTAGASLATEAKIVLGGRDKREDAGGIGVMKRAQLLIGSFQFFKNALSASDVQRVQTAHVDRVGATLEPVSQLATEVQKKAEGVKPEDKDSDDKEKKKLFEEAQFAKLQIDDLKSTQRRILSRRLLQIQHPEIAQGLAVTANIDAQLARLKQVIPLTLVMRERKDSTPKAHILDRGDYASPGEEVTADVPEVLPAFRDAAPKNRLGLAGWMVSPENPLTARVIVNRYWYYLFGTGIVESTEDFGVTGSLPSHPELLNWMAADFVEHDWDLKRLLRTVVTSSTYRQSQTLSSKKIKADPDNRLLSRGPRVRLDGEQLRDMALTNSELLVDKVGGPPVRPYQPKKVWEEVSMLQSDTRVYRPDLGDGLYRRSLYTFWKRTAAPPNMTIMNSPSRDVFCVRRERTNTPLQAFVMWNDPQFVEAAKKVAEQIVQRDGAFHESVDEIGQKFLARSFDEVERKLLKATFDSALETFETDPQKAEALLQEGDSVIRDDVDESTVAAWTVVVSQVMNLDEALTK